MTELREVFEMATKQIDPDQDAWKDQERRQRRRARNRKVGAFAAVAVILIAAGVFALTQKHSEGTGLAHRGTPTAGPTSGSSLVSPIVLGLDGTVTSRLKGLPPNARSVSVSPDGRTLVFVIAQNGTSQIGTVGIDGTGLTLFPAVTSGKPDRSFPTPGSMMPAWSPDGSRIAFSDGQVYVMNADGTGATQLTSGGPGVNLWPSWSPDGSTIVYSNSGRTPLTDSGFSPTQAIWTVPANGGTPTRISGDHMSGDMPSFSPDGGTIAFFSDGRLTLMNASGRNVRPVAGDPQGFNPRWSPDGSKLMYITCCAPFQGSDGGPLLRVHTVDVATGTRSTLPGLVDSDVDAPHWVDNHSVIENRYTG